MATGFASNKFYCRCRQRKFFQLRLLQVVLTRAVQRTSLLFIKSCRHFSRVSAELTINREARYETTTTHTADLRARSLKSNQSY